MANRFSAPYFGAAYYPEAWPEEEMDKEIPLMLQAGMNAMRMGEFSWSTIWPQEDKFDFSRLDAAVQKLEKAGIASILCTPSATPPAWLTKKYPDMLSVNQAGLAVQHGGRRHCCSRNPHYISYSLKIAEEMAKHFGKNSAVIGWQLDNEIYVQNGLGCFCPHCVSGFSGFLKEKYETIENLNDKWCTALWSQRYDDFSQIPAPQNAWHHPQLLTDWTLYQVQGHIDFLTRQAQVIRQYSSAPIGTDLMPTALIDFEKIASFCDVLQFNHYNEVENTRETAFWFAYLRGQKKPFWNTETATNWNGSTECFMGMKPEGWCRANSLMPFLYGGGANLYWLWRAHRAGHELMHGSVISSAGKPLYNFGEVAQTGADLRAAASFLQNSSPAPARVALHFSGLTWAMRMFQNVVAKRSYFTDVLPIFNALTENGVDADVIGPGADLSGYDVVFSPYLLTLEQGGLAGRMREFVKNGGTWVVGPQSDMRDGFGGKYTKSYTGMLEDFCGVCFDDYVIDAKGLLSMAWQDGAPYENAGVYQDVLTASEPLARITGGNRALAGKAVAARAKVGRGTVIVLGGLPGRDGLDRIIKMVCPRRFCHTPNVLAAARSGKRHGLLVGEFDGKPGSLTLDEPMRDLLTGKEFRGEISLSPYDFLVLEKK